MAYDVILVHPPAIYDFRKKPIFPGALGSSSEAIQFVKVAIGMISIADYLDRHDYKVIIDNLADRMVSDKDFDVEEHIKNSQADIYAVGLHWHHHAQGAIEIARLYKSFHPDSFVILGGITATCFHEEIIRKYGFIDAVVRGEGERPMLELVQTIKRHGKLDEVPNLTFRTDKGDVRITPLLHASASLDEFEFTRFDLLEPKTSVFSAGVEPRGNLMVCRGCTYNCITCGGSGYSYRKYFGMEKPAFRSPAKIVEDIKKLNQQGIRFIGLFQDPRMGGEKYWKELMIALRKGKFDIERLSMDIFAPVDDDFVREVASIGIRVVLYICPDTGADCVRMAQGRCYTTEELLESVKLCHRYHIPVQIFFSVGLVGETRETIKEMWQLWDKLSALDKAAIDGGSFGIYIDARIPIGGPIVGPIILEPGSLAFDFPEKHGYKLIFDNLEKYVAALSEPSWHQWLNHETKQLDRGTFIELIFSSVAYSIHQRSRYGVYDDSETAFMHFRNNADRFAVKEINYIMSLPDPIERESRLKSLKDSIDSALDQSTKMDDPYDYQKIINNMLDYYFPFMR